MGRVSDLVYQWAEPIAWQKGLELVDTEFVKEGGQWYLRVFIDRDGGVTIDDCQAVSQALEVILEEKDPTEHSYILEVSSPGIDRPFKTERDYQRNIGKVVEVKTFAPVQGEKLWIGELAEVEAESLIITAEDEEVEIPRQAIAQARLHIKFDF